MCYKKCKWVIRRYIKGSISEKMLYLFWMFDIHTDLDGILLFFDIKEAFWFDKIQFNVNLIFGNGLIGMTTTLPLCETAKYAVSQQLIPSCSIKRRAKVYSSLV